MRSLKTVKAWLRLFRAHTAVLEAPLAILGAALALGTIWKPVIILWGVFGVIYHFTGYGMNSYVDWKKGFDKGDPRKQHHPLNTGEIEPENAKKAILASLALLIIFGLAIANFSKIAIISVVIMLASGVTYNYFGKYIDLKFIPISIVHTMVFVFPYMHYQKTLEIPGSKLDILFIFMTVAYFIHHTFQIMISGDIKDIDQDEASLIKTLGAELRTDKANGVVFDASTSVLFTGYILMIASIGSVLTGFLIYSGIHVAIFAIIFLSSWMLFEGDNLVQTGPYKREKRVVYMSRKELSGYLMIHAATIPVIGIRGFGVLVVLMMAYLLGMSKLLWGNWIKPEV